MASSSATGDPVKPPRGRVVRLLEEQGRIEAWRSIPCEAMTAGESITVECPGCGDHFQDWWRPCANIELDPDLADPGYLDCAATATCPHCGKSIRLGVLTADGDVWRRR